VKLLSETSSFRRHNSILTWILTLLERQLIVSSASASGLSCAQCNFWSIVVSLLGWLEVLWMGLRRTTAKSVVYRWSLVLSTYSLLDGLRLGVSQHSVLRDGHDAGGYAGRGTKLLSTPFPLTSTPTLSTGSTDVDPSMVFVPDVAGATQLERPSSLGRNWFVSCLTKAVVA
jgi:hypothetical protein